MERRLIDANALEANYRTQFNDVYKHIRDSVNPSDFFIERKAAYDKELARLEMEAFCEYLQSRPTIDAVEVVRCRECKHYAIDWPTGKSCCVRNGKVVGDQVWGGMVIVKDGYCNFGERREPDEKRNDT